MKEYVLLMVSAALVNNVILARFLGLCSFMGVTTRIDTAIGMGMATTFVITVSSMADWAVESFLLQPFGLGYLRTVTFILVIAAAFIDYVAGEIVMKQPIEHVLDGDVLMTMIFCFFDRFDQGKFQLFTQHIASSIGIEKIPFFIRMIRHPEQTSNC